MTAITITRTGSKKAYTVTSLRGKNYVNLINVKIMHLFPAVKHGVEPQAAAFRQP